MKKSIGELSLIVVVLLAIAILSTVTIFLVTTEKNVLITKIMNILNLQQSNFENEYPEENNDISKLPTNSKISYENIPKLSIHSKTVYKKENEIENLLKNSISTKTKFAIDKKIEAKLKKETIKILKKEGITPGYEYQYYEKSNNSYIVNVTNQEKSKEYYITYTTKKSNFLKIVNYEKQKIIEKDTTSAKIKSENLKESEYRSEFSVEKDYDESYLSKAELDQSKIFSENENIIKDIYGENKDSIVVLNTYKNDVITGSATGFFLTKGIIATSWSYINEAMTNATNITALTSSKKTYKIEGIIAINQETDIALLKLEDEMGKEVRLGNIDIGEEVAILGTFSGFGISGKIGVNLKNDNVQTNSLSISKTNIGSPLWNKSGEVIGMVTGHSIEKDISNSVSTNELKKYKNYYGKQNFQEIKTYSISELENNYYKYKIKDQTVTSDDNLESIGNQYKNIGHIKETILLPIVKVNSQNNKLSIRYRNDTGMDNDIVIQTFIIELEKEKYQKKLETNKKKIYKGNSSKITIYYEFNYIIIIMELI